MILASHRPHTYLGVGLEGLRWSESATLASSKGMNLR